MPLPDKIVSARKKKGLNQEELAEMAHVTVRTIQRIESGESMPRSYTLKAIAAALGTSLEELQTEAAATGEGAAGPQLRQLLCLSCFAYLLVPYIHFLAPAYLLKHSKTADPRTMQFGRRLIRGQLYWLIALHGLMLLTLAYNFLQAAYFDNRYFLHYLWPVFAMYIANAVMILLRLKSADTQ
jgi:transcriptional regulator with XRE-family HTH domain